MTVDITDIYPEAVKVSANEVSDGDFVYDTFGGTHEVKKVTRFKHVTRITRVDGWPITLDNDETITILQQG